jgi:hypothetical protein
MTTAALIIDAERTNLADGRALLAGRQLERRLWWRGKINRDAKFSARRFRDRPAAGRK